MPVSSSVPGQVSEDFQLGAFLLGASDGDPSVILDGEPLVEVQMPGAASFVAVQSQNGTWRSDAALLKREDSIFLLGAADGTVWYASAP